MDCNLKQRMPKSKKVRQGAGRQSGVLALKGSPQARDLTCWVRQHTFRFNVSNAITVEPVYGYDMLGLIAAATSATGATSVISAVRLKQVILYSSGTNAASLGIIWAGGHSVPSMMSTTVLGTAEPAMMVYVPPPESEASFPISYNERANTYFTITAPTGTIIDVVVDFLLANGVVTSPAYVTYVSSGLVTGQLYYGPLDKQTGAPKIFPVAPVSYYG